MAEPVQNRLVGREQETARLGRFVASIPGGPRGVLIRGEAGIGKTALWNVLLEQAREAGLTTLEARAVETELPLGLVGVSDLVADALELVQDDLPDHQRAALAAVAGLEPPDNGAVADAVALGRAFLALVHAHAARGPVLLAVDDAQWLDEASRRVLAFAVRRLRGVPVGVAVTQRGDGSDRLELARALDGRFQELRLRGLSVTALAQVVRDRLDTRLPRPQLSRLHSACGGNPLFALEFARQSETESPPAITPPLLPASLEELVRTRVARLPRAAQELLAAAAAVERPTLALLRSLEPDAERVLEAAVDARAVLVDGSVVRFGHPLLAAAAYAALSPSERRDLHRRLADTTGDVEERGRHLALATTEPAADVADALDKAAARANARGAPEAAAELAQEAVRLTPPPVEAHLDRLLAVAEYLGYALRTGEACAWLDRLLSGPLAGSARARVLMLRTTVEHDIELAGRALEEAVDHVEDDAALRSQLLLMLSAHSLYVDDVDASERCARQALELAERIDDRALVATALAMLSDRLDLAGRTDDSFLERALDLEDAAGPTTFFVGARERLAGILLRRGDLGAARELLEEALAAALRAGSVPDWCRISVDLFELSWRAGEWDVAERYLTDAWNLAVEDMGDPWGIAELPVKRARLAALRGDVEAAREFAALGIERADAIHWRRLARMNRWVLGFLELSLGNAERAWQALEDVANPAACRYLEELEAAADAVETLVALDRLDDAADLVSRLEAAAAAGHVWASPAARRCSALMLVARGETNEAKTAAEEAARGFAAAGFPLDEARSLFVAGEALRRAGRRTEAAERLEAALAAFGELGATLWKGRAEAELRRARPRPRRDGELTNAERRVAALVADGRSNREVAAQLFTTVATVEAHLTRIYRKLEIRSRTELARRAAEGTLLLTEE